MANRTAFPETPRSYDEAPTLDELGELLDSVSASIHRGATPAVQDRLDLQTDERSGQLIDASSRFPQVTDKTRERDEFDATDFRRGPTEASVLGALTVHADVAGDGTRVDYSGLWDGKEFVSPDERTTVPLTVAAPITTELPVQYEAWPKRPEVRDDNIADDESGITDVVTDRYSTPRTDAPATELGEAEEEAVTLATEGLDDETVRDLYNHAQRELSSLFARLDNGSNAGNNARNALFAIFQEYDLTHQDYMDLVRGDDAHNVVRAVRNVFVTSDLEERAGPAARTLHEVLGINVRELAAASLLVTDDVKLDVKSIGYRIAEYMNSIFEEEMEQAESDTEEVEPTAATPDGHWIVAGHDLTQIGAQLRESTQQAWSQARGWLGRLGHVLDSGAAAQDPATMRYVQQAQPRVAGQPGRMPTSQTTYSPSSRYAQSDYPQQSAPRPAPRAEQGNSKDDPDFPEWMR